MVGNGTIPLAAKVMKELGLGQYRKTRCVERERQAGPNLRVGKLITALSSSIRNLVAFAFFEMPVRGVVAFRIHRLNSKFLE